MGVWVISLGWEFGTARVRIGSCVVVWVMGLGGCFVGAWNELGGGWWLVCEED